MIIGDIMEQQILDIFYNKIVHEAQTGRVDCFFMMNMIFNLNENEYDFQFKCRKYSNYKY